MNAPARQTVQLTRVRVVALAVVCAIAAPALVLALPPARTPSRVGAAFAANGGTSVLGVAWRADNTPLDGAHVRLRNLTSGKIEANAVADEIGQFSFAHLEGGTYVVELLGQNDRVVTVGHAFVIAPGETVATFVRLGTKVPWFQGFFGNAASAVATSAASQGITAMAPTQLPESRR